MPLAVFAKLLNLSVTCRFPANLKVGLGIVFSVLDEVRSTRFINLLIYSLLRANIAIQQIFGY